MPKCGFSGGFPLKRSILQQKRSTGSKAKKSLWDQFSSAKTTFLSWYETPSKHHRRWLAVQRTCLKPFLTSEGHLGRTKSRGRLSPKIGIFWRFFSSGCAYVCKYFLVGCAPQKGPKGSYLRGKSCPTSLRYLVLKKSDFESIQNRDFIPPPANTWSRSFKKVEMMEDKAPKDHYKTIIT